jgi:hypothetical protein
MVSASLAGNYFSARIEVALQYASRKGKMQNLLGSVQMDEKTEASARAELHKWNPVRRHAKDFLGRGRSFSGNSFRLRARVYARDIYQFGMKRNEDIPALNVTFALTLSDGSSTSDLYNEMRSKLGTFVESAVIEHEIEVQAPSPSGAGSRRR